MKLVPTHHTNTPDRQTKNPRRRLWFAGLFSVILLLSSGCGTASIVKETSIPSAETVTSPTPLVTDSSGPATATAPSPAPLVTDTSRPATETAPPPATRAGVVQLAWPAVGQAAVGSVEDGLLARSSDNEALRPTASMAKVITALAIMEKQPFELGQEGQTYTIMEQDIESMRADIAQDGSTQPLLIGMELTQYQALQRMLIASDNTMADILAERIFGSKAAYVSYAQDMLKRMGLRKTVVADASGFSPDTASTPSELVALGIAALKNSVIAQIVAQPQAQLPVTGLINNTNQLLGSDGVIGIKTGTTAAAGYCLLFAARYAAADGQKVTIVAVIMGDTDAPSLFSDSLKLLASARQGLGLAGAQPAGTVV